MDGIQFVSGATEIDLVEHHRFSNWLTAPHHLYDWKRWLESRGDQTAIGQCSMGFALYVNRIVK